MVMKKISIVLLFTFMSMAAVFAQEQSLLRKGFSLGANYTNVKNKVWETTNYSIGIFGEYELPLIKKIGVSGLATAGIDRMQGCNLCESAWYKQGIWWGFALKRPFQIENQQFSIQFRGRWFGFGRTEPTRRNSDGELTNWIDAKSIIKVFGFRFGYKIPVEIPLELTYSYESNAIFRVSTFGLAYQF
jgi:hypothetical protein